MIRAQNFPNTLANLSPNAPIDLDDILAPTAAAPAPLARRSAMPLCPPTALWSAADETITYIGIRVETQIEAPEHLAARLCAAAIERQVVPIFLSHLPSCEMLRFGFRVELIAGETDEERAESETQLRQMWNLAIIVDISDAARLG